MTLLTNRARTAASDDEMTRQHAHPDGNLDGRAAAGRKISLSPKAPASRPAVNPPEDALRTLRARLQAQLSSGEGSEDGYLDGHNDPEARFLAKSVHRRLNQVNAALERIEEGKYGVCADCDELIEQDRLVLQPMSTRCTRCQTVAEWRGTAY